MTKIQFLIEYKCHKEGSIFEAQDHFAEALISLGYAKAMDAPPRNKMIAEPKEKKSIYVG